MYHMYAAVRPLLLSDLGADSKLGPSVVMDSLQSALEAADALEPTETLAVITQIQNRRYFLRYLTSGSSDVPKL